MNRATAPAGRLRTWFASVPIFILLVIVVVHGTGVMLHGQLLRLGESLFPSYSELRTDPVAPTCDPDGFGNSAPVTAPGGAEDDFLDDLFGDPGELPSSQDSAVPTPGDLVPAVGVTVPSGGGTAPEVGGTVPSDGELVPEVGGTTPPAGEFLLEVGEPDSLGGELAPVVGGSVSSGGEPTVPTTSADDEILDGLFGDAPVGRTPGQPSAAAIEAARNQCLAAHIAYTDRVGRITGGLKTYRGFERAVASLVRGGDAYTRHFLVLLILICGIVATGLRAHIALRPITTLRDDRVSQLGQLLANGALFFSCIVKYRVDRGVGIDIQHASLPVVWMVGFAIMAAINVRHLLKPPADAEAGKGVGMSLLTIPLFAIMAILAATYFFTVESHPAGPAIYLQKLTENAKLYLQVGLYVWTGMLLKRTRIARLAFDVLRPFKMPPEILASIVVAGAAFPTAYSGASGIFVIAAGAVIYDEMRRAGAHRQLALATTAMSGSLGVVLSPCLLVVVVAALNYEVTTSELYHWGWRVYGISAVLFFIGSVLSRRHPFTFAPLGPALRGSAKALLPLIPYVLIAAALLVFYALVLGTRMNEHTAPTILPILMLFLLFYDRRAARKAQSTGDTAAEPSLEEIPKGFRRATVASTDEATAHCGALLMLMGLSISLGGVIERSDVMSLFPQTFGSMWLAMGLLVLAMVFIGMIMDPYGAVILVSVTLAPVAYANGIHPLHFWMVVLAAFELGYLTPPVALNQLLTNQVVRQEPEVEEAERHLGSYWQRHLRLVLPLSVMGLRLFLVGLVPLFFY